jgi:hypothetical protein
MVGTFPPASFCSLGPSTDVAGPSQVPQCRTPGRQLHSAAWVGVAAPSGLLTLVGERVVLPGLLGVKMMGAAEEEERAATGEQHATELG